MLDNNIIYNEEKNYFHLSNNTISYIIGVEKDRYLSHLYFGNKLSDYNRCNSILEIDRGFAINPEFDDRKFSQSTLNQEYSSIGYGDFRNPAFLFEQTDGSHTFDFRYKGYTIIDGKQLSADYPHVKASSKECKTLQLVLQDVVADVELVLSYTILQDIAAIVRKVEVHNNSSKMIKLNKIDSCMLDFPNDNYEITTLSGSHTHEANINTREICQGNQGFSNHRYASGPFNNPFVAISTKNANEEYGEILGVAHVYSGSSAINVELDAYDSIRLNVGIDSTTFKWELGAGESFETPECILVYSNNGFQAMSHAYHKIINNHIISLKFRGQPRPILVNNWEATFMDFDNTKIIEFINESAKVGAELFVLDDGWFKGRNNDSSSLGDWIVDKDKFPNGLEEIQQSCKNQGLQFGLWFEPEMVSESSDLYKKNPEWVLSTPKYDNLFGRNQLVLDLGNDEVQEFIISTISEYIIKYELSYIKWDMNRHISDIYSSSLSSDKQGEAGHRYMLGLYKVLKNLTDKFTDVLFEGCASGGGRFDIGMLQYFPQIWASDNTDAVCRTTIQYGLSLVYPPSTMGAHISDVPNNQVGRITPMQTRFVVAMSGLLGYEFDLISQSVEEKNMLLKYSNLYKQYRKRLMNSDYYRLKNPFVSNEMAHCFVSEDKELVIAMYVRKISEPSYKIKYLRFKGLEKNALYKEEKTQKIYSGSELMNIGLTLPRVKYDFFGELYILEKVSNNG